MSEPRATQVSGAESSSLPAARLSTVHEMIEWIAENGVTEVECLVPDLAGCRVAKFCRHIICLWVAGSWAQAARKFVYPDDHRRLSCR